MVKSELDLDIFTTIKMTFSFTIHEFHFARSSEKNKNRVKWGLPVFLLGKFTNFNLNYNQMPFATRYGKNSQLQRTISPL